jgi:hypothetical protein
MASRVVSVAAVCVLLFAPAALVGCSSLHHAAKEVSQGVSSSSSPHPENRLIVLGESIAGISLGEPRKSARRSASRPWTSRSPRFRRLVVCGTSVKPRSDRVFGVAREMASTATRDGVGCET